MTDGRTSSSDDRDALPPASTTDALNGPRAELAKVIPRRPRVSWWLGILLATIFSLLVLPSITADRWLGVLTKIERGTPTSFTARVPPFAGYDTAVGHTGGGGVLIARGEVPDRDTAEAAANVNASLPHGPVPYIAYLLLVGVLAGLFTHHTRRSTQGRLLRVQLVSLGMLVVAAILVKVLMLATTLSVLVIPVALFSMVPTLVLDRVVGLATGTLAAVVMSLMIPFDVGVAVMLMVQAGAAGLVIADRPKKLLRAALTAGAAATLFTAATYPLMLYLTAGRLPLEELRDPLHSAWLACALGPAIATVLAIPLAPLYQRAVGEITRGKLVELEDLSNPLLRQIATKAPGSWQHSLAMANMAEIAANAIGANGRLVRVGALYHDLGKSLQPKYFIENLEPGETSPHDKLPPEVSCDAIFAHVTEGIVTARKAGLHERIIDFMHMHHGNGVLEYFWGKTREQGNPRGLSVEHFRYPGVPPQSRETAILSICDAVEAASRTLKKPEIQAIDNLVQRIVYGKLHLGQLDESGLSMGDLRRMAESLRETIRHANHGRIEYPWQKAQQDASAPPNADKLTQTGPRLDSLDRPAQPDTVAAAAKQPDSADSLSNTGDAGATPKMKPQPRDSSELALKTTASVARPTASTAERAAQAQTWKADAASPGQNLSAEISLRVASGEDDETIKYPKEDIDDVVELRATKPSAGTLHGMSPPKLADLAASTQPPDAELVESDPRMRRVTNQVGEVQPRVSQEVVQFATDANKALAEASKDMPVMPRDVVDNAARDAASSADIQIVSQQIIFEERADRAKSEAAPASPSAAPASHSAARKRAATLPPLKTPTMPPPMGRRSPTLPPAAGLRPPTMPSSPPNMTVPPPTDLRPPAPAQIPLPGMTAPPPLSVRPPGINYLDDMITLRPQYEVRTEELAKAPSEPALPDPAAPATTAPVTTAPAPKGGVTMGWDVPEQAPPAPTPAAPTAASAPQAAPKGGVTMGWDIPDQAPPAPTGSAQAAPKGGVTMGWDVPEPSASAKMSAPPSIDDALITQPRMRIDSPDTAPNLELPLRAPVSSPAIPVRSGGAPFANARVAARIDAQLDDDFGTETPVSAPTRAELQALLDTPPDVTRQQSLDEIEALHRLTRDRPSQDLDFTRRQPYPTTEVDEADIEAAIELAPPARRTAIGVAKKPTKE